MQDKIVFITGASSGIGEACARRFAQAGAKLLLCARRMDRLKKIAKELNEANADVHIFELDVRKSEEIDRAFEQLPTQWRQIDLLVNNAGLARGLETVQQGALSDWEEMLDTNVRGLLYITRKVLPSMVERNSGHVINIGSVASHWVYPKGAVYCATKHAVKAISEGLRMDLYGTKIRVSSVDPGAVQTEFSEVRFHGDTPKAKLVYEGFEPLTAKDIADAVFYCAQCPPHVNISEMIIMPTAQAAPTMIFRNNL